ncbi:unnamed protein product [Rotaria magnacalcarata]|nr:unnamed protein product [Rotaria magnacalcarata]CAF4265002.1 unnamed protein product [Rotaria magnacalcarata]
MASASTHIYDIMFENYAYSSTGELGTKFVSSCVAVIVIFVDNTVLIEHRSDLDLCRYGKQDEVEEFLKSVVTNICELKDHCCNIRDAFIIGGCKDEIKTTFMKS